MASIKCLNDCELLILSKADFERSLLACLKKQADEKANFIKKYSLSVCLSVCLS
jgi:hypothetical protein